MHLQMAMEGNLTRVDKHTIQYKGGSPQMEFLLEYRLPPLGECSRNLSVPVYQMALVWDTAFSFSEFFGDFYNALAHFMMGD